MQAQRSASPRISVIVLCYDMRREVARTMMSLSPAFQKVDAAEYDIDLVEMPSERMLTPADLEKFPENLRYTAEPENLPLSVAVNAAVARARAGHVLICVDGARILSAGILGRALQIQRFNPRGIMAVHGLHLGSRPQQIALADGTHSTAIEDALLDSIDFPNRPHGLWRIACWAGSSKLGVFGRMAESCAMFLPRQHFESLGGYDTDIDIPGGGLANSDFYTRAIADLGRPLFVPLGEGTFHQCHGGSTTGAAGASYDALLQDFARQTGRTFRPAVKRAVQYLGSVPEQAYPLLQASLSAMRDEAEADQPRDTARAVAAARVRAGQTPARRFTPRDVVLIAGMHRSGTSFVARQLSRNGYVIPGAAMAGSAISNPEGHFEPLEIVGFNNTALRSHGARWHSLTRVDWDADKPGVETYWASALRHLLMDLDKGPGWVIKDPRLCLMTGIWDGAMDLLGIAPKRLVVLRDPMLVARSLHKRDGMPVGHGLLLWARYVLGMWTWVRDPGDVLCLDVLSTEAFAETLERQLDRGPLDLEPVRKVTWPDATDPISSAYRRFTEDRDGEALLAVLRAELGFAERYADYVAATDHGMRHAY